MCRRTQNLRIDSPAKNGVPRAGSLQLAAALHICCPCRQSGRHPQLSLASMHMYPKRSSLKGLEIEIFKLVSYSSTPEQWKEWLRVPLEHAAARGNLDIFDKLLGAGADGSAGWRGCRNRTLLDAAAVGGNADVVSGLIQAGAEPDVNEVSCSSKRSALYTAVKLGHVAVARRLVIAGAWVNFHDPVEKCSLLHEATLGGHESLVTELLIGGANPNKRDGDDGASPLHFAAYRGLDGIASTLMSRGADKDALDVEGDTPLIYASHEGRLSVVKLLLSAGAAVSVRGTQRYSALDCAAVRGHVGVIEAIVEHGADVNTDNDRGFTALHAAATNDHVGAVESLIKAGADVESKSNAGNTPLSLAAHSSSRKAVLALLQHGAKVDVRDYGGSTPLHAACWERRKGLEAVVDLLLRWGADETTLNDAGHSPTESLDLDYGDVENSAAQDEIDRTRLLLAQAPADRAWRRRGWLVMLRLCGSKVVAASRDDNQRCGGSSRSVCNRHDGGSKVARMQSRRGAESGVHGKTGAMSGASGEGERWGDVVESLLGLEVEGIFRTGVGFL